MSSSGGPRKTTKRQQAALLKTFLNKFGRGVYHGFEADPEGFGGVNGEDPGIRPAAHDQGCMQEIRRQLDIVSVRGLTTDLQQIC